MFEPKKSADETGAHQPLSASHQSCHVRRERLPFTLRLVGAGARSFPTRAVQLRQNSLCRPAALLKLHTPYRGRRQAPQRQRRQPHVLGLCWCCEEAEADTTPLVRSRNQNFFRWLSQWCQYTAHTATCENTAVQLPLPQHRQIAAGYMT